LENAKKALEKIRLVGGEDSEESQEIEGDRRRQETYGIQEGQRGPKGARRA